MSGSRHPCSMLFEHLLTTPLQARRQDFGVMLSPMRFAALEGSCTTPDYSIDPPPVRWGDTVVGQCRANMVVHLLR